MRARVCEYLVRETEIELPAEDYALILADMDEELSHLQKAVETRLLNNAESAIADAIVERSVLRIQAITKQGRQQIMDERGPGYGK